MRRVQIAFDDTLDVDALQLAALHGAHEVVIEELHLAALGDPRLFLSRYRDRAERLCVKRDLQNDGGEKRELRLVHARY